MDHDDGLEQRAARHAALGDPVRLAIVDELAVSDRAPVELRHRLGIESNLLAHHLDVLERVGLIERSRSSGDGRRRYVHLRADALDGLAPGRPVALGPGAVRLHRQLGPLPARGRAVARGHRSPGRLGRHPPRRPRSHPGAVAAARRAGLDLGRRRPRPLDDGRAALPPLVVTVCDRAHEELDARRRLAALVDPRPGARPATTAPSTPRWPSCAERRIPARRDLDDPPPTGPR